MVKFAEKRICLSYCHLIVDRVNNCDNSPIISKKPHNIVTSDNTHNYLSGTPRCNIQLTQHPDIDLLNSSYLSLQPMQHLSSNRHGWRQPRDTCLNSLIDIPSTSLQKVRKLGEGEFGVVLEGIYSDSEGHKVGRIYFCEK